MKSAIPLVIYLIVALTSNIIAQSVPALVNYQGRLTDASGAPLAVGNYSVAFRLWDRQLLASGQTLIWGREYDVTIVEGGAFNVILGAPGGRALSGSPPAAVNDLNFAFGQTNRFLGLTIVRDATGQTVPVQRELVPRQQILSTPFAITSERAAFASVAGIAEDLVQQVATSLVPPSTVVAWMGTNNAPPSGWEFCWGQAVSRTDPKYARLFSIIGTSNGNGDGSSTFHLPDMRAMFLRGVNGSRSDTNFWDPDIILRTNLFLGGNVGNSVGSVQKDEFRSHVHSEYRPVGGAAAAGGGPGVAQLTFTGPAGGNETRPKNIYVHYIIKL